ncbi:MAG: FdtA/QdtA family cupin domain-containing protein [Muribaculaceae bacterium]|nr:FdtA/QdtA family cupin domain-containing protein [Muribaculaceae bacterium]
MDFTKPGIFELPKFTDSRGSLSFAQNFDHVPFEIKRVFWIYDVPEGEKRGGHSHNEVNSVLIAVAGSMDINLFDGEKWEHFHLDSPNKALIHPRGYWVTLENFSPGSVCMVLVDGLYNKDEYERDLDNFIESK